MFIDQLVPVATDKEAEIIEATEDALDLVPSDQLHRHTDSVPADPVEELILNVNLILDHGLPPFRQKFEM